MFLRIVGVRSTEQSGIIGGKKYFAPTSCDISQYGWQKKEVKQDEIRSQLRQLSLLCI